ncbi:MAG: DGQHR domain-containing protein DpdB [Gemmatimonadota bacterium]
MPSKPLTRQPRTLRLPAIELRQSGARPLYSFAMDGKDLPKVASVSRIRREGDAELRGYQRPEVQAHITEIQKYLESSEPILPNAIVVAFDTSVHFEPSRGRRPRGAVGRHGTLVVPVAKSANDVRPGWIVDGQQRAAAIERSALDAFPVFVIGFVARSDEEQREQFILVNATKPLPKGLIYELLPMTKTRLPSTLGKKRFPAALLAELNQDRKSPFHRKIRTPTSIDGVVRDNSVLRMLENSLTDGILYWLRDPHTGAGEPKKMLKVVKDFWWSVSDLFPEAWEEVPRRSRLTHGAGIVSMGMLMDSIAEGFRRQGLPDREAFSGELAPLEDSCAWMDGYWQFRNGERRRWNEIQNTSKDIALLADHLLSEYRLATSRVG